MDLFKDQIYERQQNDAKMFENAFSNLSSVLDADFIKAGENGQVDAAITRVLNCIGVQVPKIPSDIDDDERLAYILRETGAMHRRVELIGKWWKDANGSMLGSTLDGDVIAIIQTVTGDYEYTDKDNKTIKIDKNTAQTIADNAFCFYRPFPAKKLSTKDLIFFAIKCITRGDYIFVLTASLLVSVTGMLLPFLNKQIFDTVIPAGIKGNIAPMTALLLSTAIGTALFSVTRGLLISRLKDKIDLTVQSAVMMRLFSLPAVFFKKYSAGELANRAMGVSTLFQALSSGAITTWLAAIFSVVFVIQMAQYAPSLIAPGLLTIALMIIFLIASFRVRTSVASKRLNLGAKLSGLTYGIISGVQKIRLSGATKRAFAKWAQLYSQSAKLTYAPSLILRIDKAVILLISLCGSLVLYYFAGTKGVSPAEYMAFIAAFGAISSAVLMLLDVSVIMAELKPVVQMVTPILEAVPERTEGKEIVTALSGSIEINSLTFRYNEDGPAIIDNLSLKIRSGEYVAVVGKTGCGKSTLLRLLLGFEKPEMGVIYYDGKDLDSLDAASVRRNVGVCLQNGQLFSGDIFSNIIITSPNKSLDDAWEAARMAGCEKDIKDMPMNMHTMISEGGGGISGGQKQRLLIARALVNKPRILFFDEATSALDNITQKHVSDSISALKCTRIVIAHRLSTIKQANRIIVLDSGKIVEDGNYDTLMENKGIFYEMAKRQTY